MIPFVYRKRCGSIGLVIGGACFKIKSRNIIIPIRRGGNRPFIGTRRRSCIPFVDAGTVAAAARQSPLHGPEFDGKVIAAKIDIGIVLCIRTVRSHTQTITAARQRIVYTALDPVFAVEVVFDGNFFSRGKFAVI